MLVVALSASPACAGLTGGRNSYFVCSYDSLWETAVETTKDHTITEINKPDGTIETAWTHMEGEKRPYGVFRREEFGNIERACLTVAVKKMDDVTSVNLLKIHQRRHAKDGASRQATKWWSVEPSEEAMKEVAEKLHLRLKEKGCEASS